jgi:hypothetical protein
MEERGECGEELSGVAYVRAAEVSGGWYTFGSHSVYFADHLCIALLPAVGASGIANQK